MVDDRQGPRVFVLPAKTGIRPPPRSKSAESSAPADAHITIRAGVCRDLKL